MLSEYIAGKKVSVPSSFISTLSRLIAGRAGFGDKLADHGKARDEASDEKHSFFVGILEKVREILKPHIKGPLKSVESDISVEEASNRFAGLSVYEVSDEFLNTPDVERPKPAAGDSTEYEAEPMTSYEDVMYAVGVLINDLNKIRARIDWIWSNYKTGLFDLAASAIATDTAIDLARNMMADVMPLTEAHGGAWKILNRYFQVQVMIQGHDLEDAFDDNGPTDNFNYDMYDLGVGTFLLAYRHVDAFARVLQPGNIPIFKDGHFGWYDASSDRQSKTGRQKFQEDVALLMPFFAELMAVARSVGDYPVQDEFPRGMEELNKTNKIPFYLVFAAQVFLDIHHVLREQAIDAFQTFETQTKFFRSEIKDHLAFHKNLRVDTWPRGNDSEWPVYCFLDHSSTSPIPHREQSPPSPPQAESSRNGIPLDVAKATGIPLFHDDSSISTTTPFFILRLFHHFSIFP